MLVIPIAVHVIHFTLRTTDHGLAHLEEHIGVIHDASEHRGAETEGRQRDVGSGMHSLIARNLADDQVARLIARLIPAGGPAGLVLTLKSINDCGSIFSRPSSA